MTAEEKLSRQIIGLHIDAYENYYRDKTSEDVISDATDLINQFKSDICKKQREDDAELRKKAKTFIYKNRKICWEAEHENGEYCIGENCLMQFIDKIITAPEPE